MIKKTTKTIKASDINEAVYYLLNGAKVLEYIIRSVPENKIKKLGFQKHWSFVLNSVDIEAIKAWKEYKAIVNVRDFVNTRVNLKEKIKKIQQNNL